MANPVRNFMETERDNRTTSCASKSKGNGFTPLEIPSVAGLPSKSVFHFPLLKSLTGFTLVELLVTIIIVGILSSIAIAMQGGALTTAKKKQCSGNLQNLYKGLFTYVALYGGARQSPPSEIGSELWVKLCTDPTDVLEQDNAGKDAEILQCPVQNDKKGPDYRGPNVDWSKIKKYVGCDIDSNHGENKGGYALSRSGATTELTGDDWQKVLDETLFNTIVSNQEKEKSPQSEEELQKELKRAEEKLSAKLNVLKYEIGRMKKATSELEESTDDERAISKISEIAEDMVKAMENVKKAKEEVADIKEGLGGNPKKIIVTQKMKANQKDAAGFLRQITSHEATWQRVDEDGNGVKDYYTFDVAGLHYHTNMLGNKLQYIDIKFAKADPSVTNWDANAKCEPMNGYYFKAMVRGGDGANYNKNLAVRAVGPIKVGTPIANPDRYGFCAYPAEDGKTGGMKFIVNQGGVRYQKDTGGKNIDQWPCEEDKDPTADGWKVVD